MASVVKEKRLSAKRVKRALLLSTGTAAAFVVFQEFSNYGCLVFESGHESVFAFAGITWLILGALFLLPGWGRVLLLLPVAFGCLAVSVVNHERILMAQVVAAGRVRTMQKLLAAYKEEHPEEGFPAVMPPLKPEYLAEANYRFEYAPIRAEMDGPAEDYVLQALPIRPDCGCTIRLINWSDRVVHHTREDRPATKADPAFEP